MRAKKMSVCNSCPRKCNTDRQHTVGICGVGDTLRVALADLHFGEEPFISGTTGSGTIFFCGCPLKCVFCQNYNISHGAEGAEISVNRLAEIFYELEIRGAHNINFVTPTHYFDKIEEALKIYRPKIPLVYNSGGYESVSNIEKDIFDIYLFDLKFYSKEKSLKYAKCPDYFEIASKAIKKAVSIVGSPQLEGELLKRGVVVRHLILPQNTADSINIIQWLNQNTPDIILSLMSQYTPIYKANDFKELSRKITKREYNKVLEHCFNTNFYDIITQDLTSATGDMIPNFNLKGVHKNI